MEKKQVHLSEVRPGEHFISLTGQVFQVLQLNASAKWIEVLCLTPPGGRGSAKAMQKGEVRRLTNGHQWCQRVYRHEGAVQ